MYGMPHPTPHPPFPSAGLQSGTSSSAMGLTLSQARQFGSRRGVCNSFWRRCVPLSVCGALPPMYSCILVFCSLRHVDLSCLSLHSVSVSPAWQAPALQAPILYIAPHPLLLLPHAQHSSSKAHFSTILTFLCPVQLVAFLVRHLTCSPP